jgi:hypothetical protein
MPHEGIIAAVWLRAARVAGSDSLHVSGMRVRARYAGATSRGVR